jgi:glycosyltransferase involved in cell wall biosynthesis
LRIFHVIAGAAQGGAETFFTDAVRALHDAGIQQHVVLRPNADRTGFLNAIGVGFETAPFGQIWRLPTAKILKNSIARFRPDVIHYWMGRAGTYSTIDTGCRRIGWYGGYYKPSRFAHCDVHVGCTRDIARNIVELGIAEERVNVLHTYADFPDAQRLNRADFDTPDNAPLLLALARLHPKKAIDILLHALPKIPGAYLWIAGDGPLKEELTALCTSLGLDNRVRFLGWRNDRGSLLATADICVFPSRYEPFGTVTAEAWAMKVPLVAAKAAGPKAYVTHEEDGLLVEIDDVDGLAAAVNRLIAEPDLRHRLVANGTATYQRDFSKEAFTANALALYSRVAGA